MNMKFQLIFIFQTIIFSAPSVSSLQARKSGKLTPEENKKRLETCGKTALERGPNKELVWQSVATNSWLFLSENKTNKSNPWITLASFISSRHLMTSSRSIANNDKTWRKDGMRMKCENGSVHLEVPTTYLSDLTYAMHSCYQKDSDLCRLLHVKPIQAFIPNFCGKSVDFTLFYSTMIVEVDFTYNGSPPCLPTKASDVKIGSVVDAYGYANRGDSAIIHRRLSITHLNVPLIGTTTFNDRKDFGGPLVKVVNDIWIIVGVSSSLADVKISKIVNTFHRISRWQDEICELVGICGAKIQKTSTTSRGKPATKIAPLLRTTFKSLTTVLTTSEGKLSTTTLESPTSTITPTVPTTSESTTTVFTTPESSPMLLTSSESIPNEYTPLMTTKTVLTTPAAPSGLPTSSKPTLDTSTWQPTPSESKPPEDVTSEPTTPGNTMTSSEPSSTSSTRSAEDSTPSEAPTYFNPETYSTNLLESSTLEDVPPKVSVPNKQQEFPITLRPPEVQKDEEEHDYEEYGPHHEVHHHHEELNFSDDDEGNGERKTGFEIVLLFILVFCGMN